MPSLGKVIDWIEQYAPSRLAADWDNVGLLLGDRGQSVDRLMTCLTVTPETADEALSRKADLILTHHPVLFKAVRKISSDTTEGRMLWRLASAGVAVYSPHTAFDNTTGGINDQLASLLGLTAVHPLRPMRQGGKVKLVVFVPETDLGKVSEALFAAGAGRIGEYSECSFRLTGTGTFRGSDASNPAVGQKGRLEEVREERLEVVCPEKRVAEVVAALRRAHSYEEPAIDVYPLAPLPGKVGEGRIGSLAAAETLAAFAQRVRTALGCGPVGFVGPADTPVRKVAIVCGAGGELLHDAIHARADVFLTGEMRYHDYLTAEARKLALVLPGHHATERPGVEWLARQLSLAFTDIETWASTTERDPIRWA